MDRKLTPKRARFVDEYLIDLNATQAAIRAEFELLDSSPERWYVYLLIDPRDGRIFYVGKGCGRRMSQHVKNTLSARETNGAKARAIADIVADGLTVIEAVFASFDDEGAAYGCEREVIESLRKTGLTNIVGGMWSARELAMERAKFLLARIKPLHDWLAGLSEETAEQINRVLGSPEEWYRRVTDELQREAEDPSPNVLMIDARGRCKFGLERP